VAGPVAPGGVVGTTDHRPAAARGWWLNIRIVRSRCSTDRAQNRGGVFCCPRSPGHRRATKQRGSTSGAPRAARSLAPLRVIPSPTAELIAVREAAMSPFGALPRAPIHPRQVGVWIGRNAGCRQGGGDQIALWGTGHQARRSWSARSVTSTPSMNSARAGTPPCRPRARARVVCDPTGPQAPARRDAGCKLNHWSACALAPS